MKLKDLKSMGFDNSRHILFTKNFYVACSQCEALCINRIPTHETSCINNKKEENENE